MDILFPCFSYNAGMVCLIFSGSATLLFQPHQLSTDCPEPTHQLLVQHQRVDQLLPHLTVNKELSTHSLHLLTDSTVDTGLCSLSGRLGEQIGELPQ